MYFVHFVISFSDVSCGFPGVSPSPPPPPCCLHLTYGRMAPLVLMLCVLFSVCLFFFCSVPVCMCLLHVCAGGPHLPCIPLCFLHILYRFYLRPWRVHACLLCVCVFCFLGFLPSTLTCLLHLAWGYLSGGSSPGWLCQNMTNQKLFKVL